MRGCILTAAETVSVADAAAGEDNTRKRAVYVSI